MFADDDTFPQRQRQRQRRRNVSQEDILRRAQKGQRQQHDFSESPPANIIDDMSRDFRQAGLKESWVQNLPSVGDGIEIVAAEAKKMLIMYVLLALLLLGLWIWALVATIINWKKIPLWAKIIAIVGLAVNISLGYVHHKYLQQASDSLLVQFINFIFKTGSIITLLVVYLSRTPDTQ